MLAILGLIVMQVPTASAQSRISLDIDAQRTDGGHGWSIGFSEGGAGCVAAATYRGGTRVWFGASARFGKFVAFANENWQSIDPGGGYEIIIQPHGGRRWRIQTTGGRFSGEPGIISGDLKIEVMEDLARASGFAIELAGRRIFSGELSGSRRALNMAFDCYERNRTEAERIAANRAAPQQPRPRPSGPPQVAGNGTGFFISDDGLIITNEHVTNGCTAVTAGVPGAEFQQATIRATDPINDLTLLKVARGPVTVPVVRTGLRLGESIAVFGYPLTSVGVASTGNFTVGYVSALAGLKNDTREFQISAPVQPGNSGGPMIDQHGNLVGVINAKLNALNIALKHGDIPQNINFAIKASVMLSFLETNGVTLSGTPSSKKMEPVDLAEHLRSFSVRVDCLK